MAKNNLVNLTQWLDEPVFYHKAKAQTLRMTLQHMADKEGAHIINPKKNDIRSFSISIINEPITPSNVPLLTASDNNWTQLVIAAGMRLLNARKASDKSFLIKNNTIIPQNYLSTQTKFDRGKILMKEAEQQTNIENKKNKYREAIEIFDEAISLYSNDSDIYDSRGIAKSKLGQHTEAINDFSKAIELKPDHAIAYYNRGVDKCKLGQYISAIEDYNKAIELKPNYSIFYNGRGTAKLWLGQHAEAINDCNKAIELQPDCADAYNSRGIVKSRLGQHTDAIEDFSKAIELQPGHVLAYCNRGTAKSKLDQHTGVIEDFSKAIELQPDHASAYCSRGIAKSKLGRRTDAIGDFSKAIELQPDHALAYCNRGIARINLKSNQYNEIIFDLEQAVKLDSRLESKLRSEINKLKKENSLSE